MSLMSGRASTTGLLTPAAEGTDGPLRIDRFGSLFTTPNNRQGISRAGRVYTITNPTFETGIANHAAATVADDSKPFLTIFNSAAVGSSTLIAPIRLRLICTAAGTNGTDLRYTIHKSAAGVSRFTSGGSSVGTGGASTLGIAQSRTSAATTAALVRAGAVVAPTDANKVRIAGGTLRSQINVVQDRYIFDFGQESPGATQVYAAATATATAIHDNVSAVFLEPQETMTFSLIATSQSAAPSYELYLELAEL